MRQDTGKRAEEKVREIADKVRRRLSGAADRLGEHRQMQLTKQRIERGERGGRPREPMR